MNMKKCFVMAEIAYSFYNPVIIMDLGQVKFLVLFTSFSHVSYKGLLRTQCFLFVCLFLGVNKSDKETDLGKSV